MILGCAWFVVVVCGGFCLLACLLVVSVLWEPVPGPAQLWDQPMEVSPEQKTSVATDYLGGDLMSSELAKSLRPSVCGCMPVGSGSSMKND